MIGLLLDTELPIVPKPKTNMSTTFKQDSNERYYLSQPTDGCRGFTDLDLTKYPVYHWEMYLGFSRSNVYTLGALMIH